MIEAGEHEKVAAGLMRAALTELTQAERLEPAAHLRRAIDALAPAIADGDELPSELAVLVAAIPLPSLPR